MRRTGRYKRDKLMKIAVLGSGTWGIALARVLFLAGHRVFVWSVFPKEVEDLSRERLHPNLPGMTIPDGIVFSADMAETVSGADAVVIATPSFAVRDTAKLLAEILPEGAVVSSVAKGLEKDTLFTMTEIIEDEFKRAGKTAPVVALSGPTHAEEVSKDMPTLITAASSDPEAAVFVQGLFSGTCIRAYTGTDPKGVELCGALKNVEALAVGIATGLGYGDNTRAALITRGMAEITRLGVRMGCDKDTFPGLSGIGDLIVTATSMHSRNNRAGILIGQGKSPEEAVREVGMVVEGMNALPAAAVLKEKYGEDMPIVSALYEIVENGADPKEKVTELMERAPRAEHSWKKN